MRPATSPPPRPRRAWHARHLLGLAAVTLTAAVLVVPAGPVLAQEGRGEPVAVEDVVRAQSNGERRSQKAPKRTFFQKLFRLPSKRAAAGRAPADPPPPPPAPQLRYRAPRPAPPSICPRPRGAWRSTAWASSPPPVLAAPRATARGF